MERIEIYSSKKKALLLLMGSVVFVSLGFWLIIEADHLSGWRANNPLLTRGIGIASILFFGMGIVVGVKRLIRSEIGLILDEQGINIHPKKSLWIKWNDIHGFEEIRIQSTRIFIVTVKNPQYWVDQETSAWKKKLMNFNITNYNSPFTISAAGYDISSDELIEKLNSYLNNYRKNE